MLRSRLFFAVAGADAVLAVINGHRGEWALASGNFVIVLLSLYIATSGESKQ